MSKGGKNFIDLTGRRFGRLSVLRRSSDQPRSTAQWVCVCDCGVEATVDGREMRRGRVKSCGCLSKENIATMSRRHGLSDSPTHKSWMQMRARCESARNPAFANYGGRGIKVCARWQSFDVFLADMGICPRMHSIDRINNDGDYEPGNCRWADRVTQNNNTRRNVWIELDGERHTAAEWERLRGLPKHSLIRRIRAGWALESAIRP